MLLDPVTRELRIYSGGELDEVRRRLAEHDFIAAVNVREQLRALRFDPGHRRLAELGPPQKSKKLNRRGRTLKITLALLVQGSCGISRPFGDERTLGQYLRTGQASRLRRRLEADAKSLFALYQYGCLHGFVRLRWGFLDEAIPAPWRQRDEPVLYDLVREAAERGVPVEAVVGGAPGWSDPWARAQLLYPLDVEGSYRPVLLDDQGLPVPDREIQVARLASDEDEA